MTRLCLLDVSRDPSLACRPVGSRPVRDPLVSLGFRTVGFVRAVAERPERLPEAFAVLEDEGAFAGLLRDGEVTEVLHGPDRRCFAEPHYALGARWVRFVSVLDDGTVVETHTVPVREPRIDPTASLDALVATLPWVAPLRWASHPLGGLRAESVPGSPAAAWGRHCQRLDQLEVEQGTVAIEHVSVGLFLEAARHVASVRRRFSVVALRSFWVTWAGLATGGGWLAVLGLGRSPEAMILVLAWLGLLVAAQRAALLAWPEAIGAPLARVVPAFRRAMRRLPSTRSAGPE